MLTAHFNLIIVYGSIRLSCRLFTCLTNISINSFTCRLLPLDQCLSFLSSHPFPITIYYKIIANYSCSTKIKTFLLNGLEFVDLYAVLHQFYLTVSIIVSKYTLTITCILIPTKLLWDF